MALDYHYYNLHKNCWSIQNRGLVIGHVAERLIDAPEFVVRPAGQRAVREQKRKNVHAFVKGEAVRGGLVRRRGGLQGPVRTEPCGKSVLPGETGLRTDWATWQLMDSWEEASYNPYRNAPEVATFYLKSTGEAIVSAELCFLTRDRKMFVWDPVTLAEENPQRRRERRVAQRVRAVEKLTGCPWCRAATDPEHRHCLGSPKLFTSEEATKAKTAIDKLRAWKMWP